MTLNEKTLILDFIQRRWPDYEINMASNWTSGNCYWFAVILVTRFSELDIYYDPIEGHFVAGDGINFYDINGEYKSENLLLLEDIKNNDYAHYERLIRDCIF